MNNFYWYISKKITQGKGFKKGFSRPIVLIAIGAIALGIAVMIISVAIVTGFQNEVRNKVIGFGAHVQVTDNSVRSKESIPMIFDDSLSSVIQRIPSVKHVQRFAIKPGILETKENVEGAIIKGVAADFDWSFFNDKLVEGVTLNEDSGLYKNSVVISETIARRLYLEVGDKVTLYFVQNQEDVKARTFRVTGIYNSGFVEFDEQYVFIPLRVLNKVSQWGIEAQIRVTDEEDHWKVEGLGFGGKGILKYSWSNSEWQGAGPHKLQKRMFDPITLAVRDLNNTYPDSTTLRIVPKDFEWVPEVGVSEGTYAKYCGGYEVLLNDYESILNADDALTFSLPYYYRSDTILNRFPEIFSWLSTLDINVIIIIILMIFVAVINMASALLIIILEKTNLIGLFRAFGSTVTQLSNVFLAVSARILILGVVIGNVIGIGFCALQRKFGIIKLDSANYYLDQVPIELGWYEVLGINAITLIISIFCMLIPVLYVSKIDPIKAIRFD